MKSTLTTILVVLFGTLSFAQTNVYQPYPLNSASWTVHIQLYDGQSYIQDWETITWTSDTTIGGQTYTRVLDSPVMIGVRQDIPNEKIYFIDDQGVEHDASFDQSAMPGDTIVVTKAFVELNSYSSTSMAGPETTTVTSIDSVLINSNYHKVIRFSAGTLIDAEYICGVGVASALTSISSSFDLACYFVDGYQYWGSSANPYCTASAKELTDQNITIYPNPSEDYFFLEYDFSAELKEVNLLDLAGNSIKQFDIKQNYSGYDISNLPSGIYLVELIFDQGRYRTTLIH